MQSGERAVFSPRFLPLLHKTGRLFLYGRYWQRYPLRHQHRQKTAVICLFGFVLCVVGRFAC